MDCGRYPAIGPRNPDFERAAVTAMAPVASVRVGLFGLDARDALSLLDTRLKLVPVMRVNLPTATERDEPILAVAFDSGGALIDTNDDPDLRLQVGISEHNFFAASEVIASCHGWRLVTRGLGLPQEKKLQIKCENSHQIEFRSGNEAFNLCFMKLHWLRLGANCLVSWRSHEKPNNAQSRRRLRLRLLHLLPCWRPPVTPKTSMSMLPSQHCASFRAQCRRSPSARWSRPRPARSRGQALP